MSHRVNTGLDLSRSAANDGAKLHVCVQVHRAMFVFVLFCFLFSRGGKKKKGREGGRHNGEVVH